MRGWRGPGWSVRCDTGNAKLQNAGFAGQRLATTPGLEQAVPAPQFTLNALAPALYNSNAQFLSSGGSKTLEGSPLVRLGWASQLFSTPIRISGAASMETERFVNAPGAAIDYIRTSARAQYTKPQDDQDFSPYLSYIPRLDFDPTFANNFATRQDINVGVDKVFNFDGAFNRLPLSPDTSSEAVWSFGFNIGAQQRFRDPSPQSHAFFFTPSRVIRHFRAVERQLQQCDNAPLVRDDRRRKPAQSDLGTHWCRRIRDPGRIPRWSGSGATVGSTGDRLCCRVGMELVEHLRARIHPMAGRSCFKTGWRF
ncbi:MAG: hypothetical protein JO139_09110 [Alphaproteobacteria bacterium]|nr:hypothetical protein [Alphaproteobacteria bacterium]